MSVSFSLPIWIVSRFIHFENSLSSGLIRNINKMKEINFIDLSWQITVNYFLKDKKSYLQKSFIERIWIVSWKQTKHVDLFNNYRNGIINDSFPHKIRKYSTSNTFEEPQEYFFHINPLDQIVPKNTEIKKLWIETSISIPMGMSCLFCLLWRQLKRIKFLYKRYQI